VERCHLQGGLQEKYKAEFENYRGFSLVSYADEVLFKMFAWRLGEYRESKVLVPEG